MWNPANKLQFEQCVRDLIKNPTVLSMGELTHHVNISCLQHCIFVSYVSFLVCRFFHWDYMAAARGGLLHDLFLYDWHVKDSHKGLHGFTHPRVALKNASEMCQLSKREQDIIVKHMWPLTLAFPRYKESYVVCAVDKFCAIAEIFHIYRLMRVNTKLQFSM